MRNKPPADAGISRLGLCGPMWLGQWGEVSVVTVVMRNTGVHQMVNGHGNLQN